jgi:hypothetical protein
VVGTWDTGAFDNDAAADLLARLGDAAEVEQRTEILREALDVVVANDDYLDYDDAAAGVAAAALVAHARGGLDPSALDTLALDTLVEGPLDIPDALVPLAAAALDRVVTGDSEWRELWAEGDELDEVLAELATQRQALISAE